MDTFMEGIVVFALIGAAVLVILAVLWYLFQTVRIIWSYSSLLAVAAVIFNPIFHIIFYLMPKDELNKHDSVLFKKYFLSIGLFFLLGILAAVLIPSTLVQDSVETASDEGSTILEEVTTQESVSDEELAMQGDISAQWRLGQMYYNGEGVRQDYTKAAEWYRKAAAHGNSGVAYAQYNLGVMYYNGEGVRQDDAQAKEWVGKACDSGLQIGCDKYKLLN